MAISYANTTEIEDIAKDINKIVSEINSEFDDLFNRLADVPYGTREWVGNKATYYFNKISSDRTIYKNFTNNLNEIGMHLLKSVGEMQGCITKNTNREAPKRSI